MSFTHHWGALISSLHHLSDIRAGNFPFIYYKEHVFNLNLLTFSFYLDSFGKTRAIGRKPKAEDKVLFERADFFSPRSDK